MMYARMLPDQPENCHSRRARRLAARTPREDLAFHPELPQDTRLWAALIQASGGVWGGCVYDPGDILSQLKAGSQKSN